ncbi:MAG: DNA-binding protein WhiA [Clostridia bacterium]
MPSFSARAKGELARVDVQKKPCCMRAELAALLYTIGSVTLLGGGSLRMTCESENAATVKRIFLLLRKRYDVQPGLRTARHNRLGGRNVYRVSLEGEEARRVLEDCGLLEAGAWMPLRNNALPLLAQMEPCCRRSFLRGAFLGSGSIASPDKEYHLEFVTSDEQMASAIEQLLAEQSLYARQVLRKGAMVVYLKDGEQIVQLLSILGAHVALCELENVRILKGLRNQVNRVTNCDSANIIKTLDAADRQVQAITLIRDTMGLERLPDTLQEIAQERLQHPEVTLQELGDLLDPPVGKSGVNHRLRRLEAIAQTLQAQKEEQS